MIDLKINERYILVDKLSGRNFASLMYQAMKTQLRKGALLVIKSMKSGERLQQGRL